MRYSKLELMETQLACPACGEPTAVSVDEQHVRQTSMQDCDVCCRPVQIRAQMKDDGEVDLDCERA